MDFISCDQGPVGDVNALGTLSTIVAPDYPLSSRLFEQDIQLSGLQGRGYQSRRATQSQQDLERTQ